MNREELKALGLSDEQIEAVMKSHGKAIGVEKEKAEKYKTDSEKLSELQAKLDAIEASKLSETEKAQKETEKALARASELEGQIKRFELKANLASAGITGENAEKLIESLGTGNIDVSILSTIISEREKASADAKEKEIAGNAGAPNGGKPTNEGNKQTEIEKFVAKRAKLNAGNEKSSSDIVSKYI